MSLSASSKKKNSSSNRSNHVKVETFLLPNKKPTVIKMRIKEMIVLRRLSF